MKRMLALLAAGLFLAGCNEPNPRGLLTDHNAVSPEGWAGSRFSANDVTIAEEFDSISRDGRIDLWRFYESGYLVIEESDTDSDGRIDHRKHMDKEVLVQVDLDMNGDGLMDTFEGYTGGVLAEKGRDLNGDGTPDEWVNTATGRVRASTVGERRRERMSMKEVGGSVKNWFERSDKKPAPARNDSYAEPTSDAGMDQQPGQRGPDGRFARTDTEEPAAPAAIDTGRTSRDGQAMTYDRESRASRDDVPPATNTGKKPTSSRYAERNPDGTAATSGQDEQEEQPQETQKPKRRFFLFSHPSDKLDD